MRVRERPPATHGATRRPGRRLSKVFGRDRPPSRARQPEPEQPGLLDDAPGWVRALVGALGAAFVSAAIVVTPVFVAWLASAASTVPASQAVKVGLDVWLVAHGVSLDIGRGTFDLTPWLLTLLPLATLRWAAQHLLAGVPERPAPGRSVGGLRRDVLVLGAVFVVSYAVVAFLLAAYAQVSGARASVAGAFAGAFLLALLAYLLAVRGAFAGDADDLAPRLAWAYREAVPRWVTAAPVPALRGVALLLLAGAVGALVLVVANFSRVQGLYGAVAPGWIGGVVLTLGQLCYLPTAAAWAVGFAAGPGFSLGAGSSVTWGNADPGLLPLVPVLGALPDPGPLSPWFAASAAVPALVGIAVGWMCVRRLPGRASWVERAEAVALGCLLTGVLTTIAFALASGPLGAGRLAHVGVSPLVAGAAVTGELLVGGVLAWLASPLRRARRA